MLCTFTIAMAKHNFGPDAGEFRPNRWLGSISSGGGGNGGGRSTSSGESFTAGSGSTTAAAAAGNAGLPDPCTFLTGPRDW
jgi:hypothetical protein